MINEPADGANSKMEHNIVPNSLRLFSLNSDMSAFFMMLQRINEER